MYVCLSVPVQNVYVCLSVPVQNVYVCFSVPVQKQVDMLISTPQRRAECMRLLFSTHRVRNMYAFFSFHKCHKTRHLTTNQFRSRKFLLEKLNLLHYMADGNSMPYLEQPDKSSNLRQLNPGHIITAYACIINLLGPEFVF